MLQVCTQYLVSFPAINSSQVLNAYRMKMRDGLLGAEGDEIARRRVEEFANKMRPAGLLVRLHFPRSCL